MGISGNSSLRSFWNYVKASKNPIQTTFEGKDYMGNIKLTIIRIVKSLSEKSIMAFVKLQGNYSGLLVNIYNFSSF